MRFTIASNSPLSGRFFGFLGHRRPKKRILQANLERSQLWDRVHGRYIWIRSKEFASRIRTDAVYVLQRPPYGRYIIGA